MADSTDSSTCPSCGSPLPATASAGLCPRCLLAMNLRTRTLGTGGDVSTGPPPSLEEMAAKFPQFDFLEYLGRGGMGIVYKARQRSLDRIVAIKILAGEWQLDPGFAGRFSREAKVLARLTHPNIVTVHDFGETGGLYYLVMEYVDGVNLRDLLRDGKLEPEQALSIVPPVCEALQYAHSQGIVHRDIKPENLLIDRDGRVKIADFGIAMMAGDAPEVAGTPAYMAPEQARHASSTDHRADIYSLGVVFYEMLTGERPQGDLVAPSSRVQVDVRIDEVVLRALSAKPELRFQSAGAMADATRTASEERVASVSSRFSAMAIVGAVWFFAFLGALLLWFMPMRYEVNQVQVHAARVVQQGDGFVAVTQPQPTPPPVPQGPSHLQIVAIGFGILASLSPAGTTILGWMAIDRIRRSKGRLSGLGLAIFDGTIFAIVLLFALVAWIWEHVWSMLVFLFIKGLPGGGISSEQRFFARYEDDFDLIGGLLITAFILWKLTPRLWRKLQQPLP